MMGCYDTVTVWNKHNNIFYRHVIPVKCRWINNIARSVSGDTAGTANSFIVIIPYSDMYKPENAWKNLSAEDKVQYFTIQKGDISALGESETEITNEKPFTANDVRNMYAPESFTVSAFLTTRAVRSASI